MANGYWNSLLDRIFEKKILVILIVMFLVLVLTLIFELNPYKSAPEETMEDFTSDFRQGLQLDSEEQYPTKNQNFSAID